MATKYAPQVRYPFDREYLRLLREGDSPTVQHFVAYFTERLTIRLSSRGFSRPTTEDIVQETFMRVLYAVRSPNAIQSPESFGAFVFGVCNYYMFKRYRKTARQNQLDANYRHKSQLESAVKRRPQGHSAPLRWSQYLLYLLLPKEERETIPGDLLEEYRTVILPTFGVRLARIWFVKQVVSSIWPLIKWRIVKLSAVAALLKYLR